MWREPQSRRCWTWNTHTLESSMSKYPVPPLPRAFQAERTLSDPATIGLQWDMGQVPNRRACFCVSDLHADTIMEFQDANPAQFEEQRKILGRWGEVGWGGVRSHFVITCGAIVVVLWSIVNLTGECYKGYKEVLCWWSIWGLCVLLAHFFL